jgi:hypothetical protein
MLVCRHKNKTLELLVETLGVSSGGSNSIIQQIGKGWADSSWRIVGIDNPSSVKALGDGSSNDGNLDVFGYHYQTGHFVRIDQMYETETDPDDPFGWSGRENIDDDNGNIWASPPTATTNRSGHFEIFALGTNGFIYHKWTDDDFGWGDWTKMPDQGLGDIDFGWVDGPPIAGQQLNKHSAVFTRIKGVLYSSRPEYIPGKSLIGTFFTDNGWNGWHKYSDIPVSSLQPAVALNDESLGGTLQVIYVSEAGLLVQVWQQAANIDTLDGGPSLLVDDKTLVHSIPAVEKNENGRLQLFVLSGNNAIITTKQKVPGGTDWTPFISLPNLPSTSPVISGPVVAKNSNGILEVFVGTSDGFVYRSEQKQPDGDMELWIPMGRP